MTYYYDKNDVLIRTATYHDIQEMKDHLRESDIREVQASHGQTPHEALLFSLRTSPLAITVLYRKMPVAVFGIVGSPMNDGSATVWLLATDGIYAMKKTFLKLSKQFIGSFLKQFPTLYNFVDSRNHVTIRWLEWCGAKFKEPIPYGPEGMLFKPFVIQAKKELVHV